MKNASDIGNTEEFLDQEKVYLKCLGSFTVENGKNKATLWIYPTLCSMMSSSCHLDNVFVKPTAFWQFLLDINFFKFAVLFRSKDQTK